jgi:hypothetical protein
MAGTGDGYAEMKPDLTDAFMAEVDRVGHEAQAWEQAKAEIAELAAAIGTGPLTEVFRPDYTAATSAVFREAENLPSAIQKSATVGRTSGDRYRSVDTDGRAALLYGAAAGESLGR